MILTLLKNQIRNRFFLSAVYLLPATYFTVKFQFNVYPILFIFCSNTFIQPQLTFGFNSLFYRYYDFARLKIFFLTAVCIIFWHNVFFGLSIFLNPSADIFIQFEILLCTATLLGFILNIGKARLFHQWVKKILFYVMIIFINTLITISLS